MGTPQLTAAVFSWQKVRWFPDLCFHKQSIFVTLYIHHLFTHACKYICKWIPRSVGVLREGVCIFEIFRSCEIALGTFDLLILSLRDLSSLERILWTSWHAFQEGWDQSHPLDWGMNGLLAFSLPSLCWCLGVFPFPVYSAGKAELRFGLAEPHLNSLSDLYLASTLNMWLNCANPEYYHLWEEATRISLWTLWAYRSRVCQQSVP